MSENLSYITLDSVISDYLVESEQGNNKYFKLFHLAFRGMEKMGIDFFYRIKAVKLPINANKTVTLPPDYRKWTKVGVLNERGEIIPLYYNNKLTTYADLWPDRTEVTIDNTELIGWNTDVWCNYWNGYAYTNIYGVPSGAPFVGDFKVDDINGVILLNEHFRYDYLMIEYVATPMEGQEYRIPVQFREAMIAWLAWKDSNAKVVRSHMTLGDRRDRERTFFNERRTAISQWRPTRISDMYQASQEQTRFAVKS